MRWMGLWVLWALPLLAWAQETFRVGDWVLRSGTGRESALIRQLSDSEWSHIGMVVAVDPEVLIVHATTDDDPLQENQVIVSTFDDFSAPRVAERVAVLRAAFVPEALRAQSAAQVQRQLGKPFVLVSRDKQPRYCTTIMVDALHAAGVSLALRWQYSDFPFLQGEYLFPQAFVELPGVEWVML